MTVLAFALLFLPLFLWLGPMWLVFYWFVDLLRLRERPSERVDHRLPRSLVAALPIALDARGDWIAGVDSPVVLAAISSAEQSYHPEALRRMQELVDDRSRQRHRCSCSSATCSCRRGTSSRRQVTTAARAEMHDSAGAHVNLGNLHFLNNDFAAAITEYERAEQLDPKLAIAFYDHSRRQRRDCTSSTSRRRARAGEEARPRRHRAPDAESAAAEDRPLHAADRRGVGVSASDRRRGTRRATLFGNYAYFDPCEQRARIR